MKYYLAVDLGGTTFSTGIFSSSFSKVDVSRKDKIRFYKNRKEIVNAIIKQINNLCINNKISKSDIIGLGIASPGPLDINKGMILNTPNLKDFQNYRIVNDFKKKLNIDTYIENDANLFALGEWYLQYRKRKIVIGVTIGTGLGLGLIIDGKLFKGANGLAMEYGLSPFQWGICEKNVGIRFIRKKAKEVYGKEISPVIIEKYFKKNDQKAIQIYNEYGQNLGIVLSHIINMIDPEVIIIGGGLSKAFSCFQDKLILTLSKHVVSYEKNQRIIVPSQLRGVSTMIGASLMVKNNKNK